MINSTASEKAVATYPKLLVSQITGNIHLFREEGTCTIVGTTNDNPQCKYPIGKILTGQLMGDYKEFRGKITLENAS